MSVRTPCCCAVMAVKLAEIERERDFHRGRAERLEAHLADLTARLERMAVEQDLRPALQASMEGRGR